MSAVKMPLAQRRGTDEIVPIKTAVNGLDCNCVCLDCGAPVVARQGAVLSWGFAHYATPGGEDGLGMGCTGKSLDALHAFLQGFIASHYEQGEWYVETTPCRYDEASQYMSDVKIEHLYEGRGAHIEIIVSHTLGDEKRAYLAYEYAPRDTQVWHVSVANKDRQDAVWALLEHQGSSQFDNQLASLLRRYAREFKTGRHYQLQKTLSRRRAVLAARAEAERERQREATRRAEQARARQLAAEDQRELGATYVSRVVKSAIKSVVFSRLKARGDVIQNNRPWGVSWEVNPFLPEEGAKRTMGEVTEWIEGLRYRVAKRHTHLGLEPGVLKRDDWVKLFGHLRGSCTLGRRAQRIPEAFTGLPWIASDDKGLFDRCWEETDRQLDIVIEESQGIT